MCALTFEKKFVFYHMTFEDRDFASRKGDPMPFPPGVGGGRVVGDANLDTFEVITADKAIDENNVGNRMLRNMGWQEGLVSFHSLCTAWASTYFSIRCIC